MSKSAQACWQPLFFIFDGYSDNEAWPKGRGEVPRRQKESGNPSADRVVKHQESWLSNELRPLALLKIGWYR
jgi:hypothetical protein